MKMNKLEIIFAEEYTIELEDGIVTKLRSDEIAAIA